MDDNNMMCYKETPRKVDVNKAGVLILLVVSLIICVSGCGKTDDTVRPDAARMLFEKSVRMTAVYIDSVNNAPDSLSLRKIVANFNTKLTTLNYEFPPDTDLELNEEENDSLIRMQTRLIREINRRDSILKSTHDSIPGNTAVDSVHQIVKKTSHL